MKKLFYFCVFVFLTNIINAQSNNCLSFDGSNDYVIRDIGSNIISGSFTLEAWIKVNSDPTLSTNKHFVLSLGGNSGGNYNQINLMITGNGSSTAIIKTGFYGFDLAYNWTYNSNWHHIAFTFNSSSKLGVLYLDGSNVASFTYGQGLNASNRFTIGTPAWNLGNETFNGNVDEVRIWNVERSASEISNNMNNVALSSSTSGLIAYYHFDQGTAGGSNSGVTTLNDATSNAYNGTLNNFALSGSSSNWIAFFAGGSGTAGDPYLVANAAHLNNVRNYLTAHFRQTADIDLTAATANGGAYYNGGLGWEPIGNSSTKFTGNYNGQSYKITGLTINRPLVDNVGLFGSANNATLQYITLEEGSVTGHNLVGGLVGSAESNNTISNCSNTGNVSGVDVWVGGLIGRINSSPVTNCFASGNITGVSSVGGLIGRTYQSPVSNCYATGSVSGSSYESGGLIATNFQSNISDCYATGNLVGTGQRRGGFIGWNNENSVVSRCYSTGQVPMPISATRAGFIGLNEGGATMQNCFWDYQTSGIETGVGTGSSSGLTSASTIEMKTQGTFTGWDFGNTWQIIGNNYPDLKTNQNSALPVELTSFTAIELNGTVTLNWQTATEVNNYGFEVERSEVGSQKSEWINIGFVQGSGNSNSPKEYSFVDENPPAGNLKYRLKQIDTDGQFEYYGTFAEVNLSTTGVEDVNLPKEFKLSQNYPNPFNPVTVISYQIPVSSNVELKVYDILGNEIAVLVNEMKVAGYYEIKFDGSNLSSGIYFYKLQCGLFSEIKKFILMK